MDFLQEEQSDLEVILEFLEEYHRQSCRENEEKPRWTAGSSGDENSVSVDEESWTSGDPARFRPAFQLSPSRGVPSALVLSAAPAPPPPPPPSSQRSQPGFSAATQSGKHPTTAAGSGRKVRLFHFLFEMLEDPAMAHCVSWVPAAAGVFRFSSRNKDQLAALWGQRKGNKRPMTYQKMSRALRNYARSGEIFKVKKKLTYQFSESTLRLLRRRRRGDS